MAKAPTAQKAKSSKDLLKRIQKMCRRGDVLAAAALFNQEQHTADEYHTAASFHPAMKNHLRA